MADVTINGSSLGTSLQTMLMADEIQPGADPSYQLCKTIYIYHPLGAKMVESPLTIATSQPRNIAIPNSPESQVKDAFLREWKRLNCDKHIFNAMRLKRIYGVSAIVMGIEDTQSNEAPTLEQIATGKVFFNVLDPINTAGSLVLNQDPNAPDFQKAGTITAAGVPYHQSRCIVSLNEEPIYIAFTSSAFGFVGRSVFQRALYPLKSYVQTMITNDLVTTKAGVIVAKTKHPGSIVDNLTAAFMRDKRDFVKEAATGNVISISVDEDIETLNMQNTDTAMTTARKNIIEDIASSANMPPKLLLADSYAGILANGTEDYKQTMLFISKMREDMQPLYDYFDRITMRRAWSPEFYATIQAQFPEEYGDVTYETAFYQWANDFSAEWPSLLEETESDKATVEKVKLDAICSIVEKMSQHLDPSNMARLMQWAADNINENKTMFSNPLDFDMQELVDYQEEHAAKEGNQDELGEVLPQGGGQVEGANA